MTDSLFDLHGKVALITGGNSGIGLGFAAGVARHGADVCIWGSNAEKNAAATNYRHPLKKLYILQGIVLECRHVKLWLRPAVIDGASTLVI